MDADDDPGQEVRVQGRGARSIGSFEYLTRPEGFQSGGTEGRNVDGELRQPSVLPSFRLSSTASPFSSHAFHPPTNARAPCHPAFLSSRVTRTLVCSSIHEQYATSQSSLGRARLAALSTGRSGRTRIAPWARS